MGDEIVNREFFLQMGLPHVSFVVSRDLGVKYRVASPPYSVIVDSDGIVRGKGITNHLEHIESLMNALEDATRNDKNRVAA